MSEENIFWKHSSVPRGNIILNCNISITYTRKMKQSEMNNLLKTINSMYMT